MKNKEVYELSKDWWKKEREPAKALRLAQPYPKIFKDSEFYTPAEVAQKLRRHVDTVYSYIQDGKIRAQPLENGYLIAGSKLNEYLEALRIRKGK